MPRTPEPARTTAATSPAAKSTVRGAALTKAIESKSRVLPTRQARGQQTVDRLLAAAEGLMEEQGLDATTVPAIAERAGVAVGTVYKRFPDKDALIREVYERFFETSIRGNRAALTADKWEGRSVREISAVLIRGMVDGYRMRRALLRSLFRFAESHPDHAFRQRADALTGEAFALVAALLLARRNEIAHPEPEKAIELGLLMIGLTLRGLAMNQLHDKRGRYAHAYPFAADDERFAAELTRAFLGYLGVR